ncbi:MAG: hypothetical protein EOR68_31955 [Mesorhizobium sp.]|uniref:hypothetical protein n=1 Tax=Mesorhizobium sp. TaxID=1871066 RepID=UPI000FE88519|nr:hypothetical protein [Mesorhizobium sp.]RWL88897.1 MAG: hypothetical protein EOR68_31955 [Mesorhizobium sp.]TJV68196.1 MAG: hypothetical protein E5X76_30620 [Mesorhizobium sp.]
MDRGARVPAAVSVGSQQCGPSVGSFVAYETVERLDQRIDDRLTERACAVSEMWASFPLRAAVASSEP